MLSFWFFTKLSHLLPLDVMLTKSVNIKSGDNRHGGIPCFCSISLCSNYQFDLFVHTDPYSPLNYPRIMFQEPPDTRRKTIADVLWNNCWPDGQNDDCGSKVVLLLKSPLHSWGLWLEPLILGATHSLVSLLIKSLNCNSGHCNWTVGACSSASCPDNWFVYIKQFWVFSCLF